MRLLRRHRAAACSFREKARSPLFLRDIEVRHEKFFCQQRWRHHTLPLADGGTTGLPATTLGTQPLPMVINALPKWAASLV
jgi:hypothetical protein